MKFLALFTLTISSLFGSPFLWMTDDDTSVYVVDTATNTLVQTIPGFSDPQGLTFTPNGAFCYIANYGENTVVVINTSNYSVVTTIEDFDEPYFLAASPNGSYIYVANYGNNTVSVVSTVTNTIVYTITTDLDGPYPLAVSPNGQYLYVGNYSGDTVSVFNTSDYSLVPTMISAGETAWIAFAPNGNAYVADYTNTITVIDPLFSPSSITSGDLSDCYFISITPNGNTAYVANYGTQTVGVIDIAHGNTVSIASDPSSYLGYAQSLAVSPDGAYVYVPNDQSLVVVNTSNNTAFQKLTDIVPTNIYFVAFQPSQESTRAFRRPENRRA
jgi:YVTN family beta-propeller protein